VNAGGGPSGAGAAPAPGGPGIFPSGIKVSPGTYRAKTKNTTKLTSITGNSGRLGLRNDYRRMSIYAESDGCAERTTNSTYIWSPSGAQEIRLHLDRACVHLQKSQPDVAAK
jgi:hypothetical protein